MIYGLIPVGGKGERLGLSFSKEMLPQKGFNFFNPILNHTVTNMINAGATKIYFIHGNTLKQDIVSQFTEGVHIVQKTSGFATVLRDFYENCSLNEEDKILFGLPDTIYKENPFAEMLNSSGIVCGLFTTDPASKVDRLSEDCSGFQIKAVKSDTNQDWFWGVIKFDGSDLIKIINSRLLATYTEIGDILNCYPNTYVYAGEYLDLGTWKNLNEYYSNWNNK